MQVTYGHWQLYMGGTFHGRPGSFCEHALRALNAAVLPSWMGRGGLQFTPERNCQPQGGVNRAGTSMHPQHACASEGACFGIQHARCYIHDGISPAMFLHLHQNLCAEALGGRSSSPALLVHHVATHVSQIRFANSQACIPAYAPGCTETLRSCRPRVIHTSVSSWMRSSRQNTWRWQCAMWRASHLRCVRTGPDGFDVAADRRADVAAACHAITRSNKHRLRLGGATPMSRRAMLCQFRYKICHCSMAKMCLYPFTP